MKGIKIFQKNKKGKQQQLYMGYLVHFPAPSPKIKKKKKLSEKKKHDTLIVKKKLYPRMTTD